MNAVWELAYFVAQTTFDDLPSEVVERAKWVLRDTVGVILGGLREPEVGALAEHVTTRFGGKATVFGHKGKVQPEWAALVHGTAGTSLEMDEGHAFARGHAAIHAVPTALARAEAFGASGKDALTALVLGYEVAARVGAATRLRAAVHPFGTWGVLGAAAIGAWFLRMDANDTAGVLQTAASYAIAPSFNTAYQGANVRNTYAGVVNQLGLMAANFYALGFRGERDGVQTTFGEMLGESFEPAALTAGLGERYEIMRGYFKPYSACRYSHAAVDATLSMMVGDSLDVDGIESIEVATYDDAALLADPHPTTPLGARFSVPHVVAATLRLGSAGPEAFTHDALDDDAIRSLAGRVRVVEEAGYSALTPAKRPARVTLHFADGSQRAAEVMGSKGDPDQPMSPAELEAKFHSLADGTVGAGAATDAWNQIGQLETLPLLAPLMDALATRVNS